MGELDHRRRLHIKRGEQLDGVSLIKRLGDVRRFVSVSRIAIDPFIRRLDQETLDMLCAQAEALKQSSAVDRLTLKNQDDLRQFAKFPYDTQLFYDPTESDEEMSDDDKRKAKVFYDTVRAACTRLEIGELPNKVAILSADGDHMGEAISKRTEIGQHRDFSRKLAVFAADARTIVAEHQGAAVYTGGDDVLAMLPLDRVLDCADALRKRFDDVNRDKPKGSATVTLSVGIAIGHYSTHLQSLLKWSRAAEHAAKDRGRNALAIAVHSGDSQSEGALFVHSWDDDPVATRWQHWIDWYRTETISRGAGYELRDLARDYADVNQSLLTKRKYPEKAPDGEDQLCSLLELDVQHLLQSKRPDGSNAMRPSEIQELRDALNNSVKGVRDLAEELIAALHFEQAITIANGPPKQQQVAPNATEPETTQDNHVTTPDEEGKP